LKQHFDWVGVRTL